MNLNQKHSEWLTRSGLQSCFYCPLAKFHGTRRDSIYSTGTSTNMHMHTIMRWCQLAIVLIIAKATVNQSNFLPQTTSDHQNRQRFIEHVSLILCHLNVKSIYFYFENTLRTNIVENLLRDTNFCDPPIVTLIKLVHNTITIIVYYTFNSKISCTALSFFFLFLFRFYENQWKIQQASACIIYLYIFVCALCMCQIVY